jgi:DNA-binding XRE family transcriptional regulator
MTVRCVSKAQKDLIAFWYREKMLSQKQLADRVGVSERTINRILVEYNLATPHQRIKGEAYRVMQALARYNISIDTLNLILEQWHEKTV